MTLFPVIEIYMHSLFFQEININSNATTGGLREISMVFKVSNATQFLTSLPHNIIRYTSGHLSFLIFNVSLKKMCSTFTCK